MKRQITVAGTLREKIHDGCQRNDVEVSKDQRGDGSGGRAPDRSAGGPSSIPHPSPHVVP